MIAGPSRKRTPILNIVGTTCKHDAKRESTAADIRLPAIWIRVSFLRFVPSLCSIRRGFYCFIGRESAGGEDFCSNCVHPRHITNQYGSLYELLYMETCSFLFSPFPPRSFFSSSFGRWQDVLVASRNYDVISCKWTWGLCCCGLREWLNVGGRCSKVLKV